MDRNSKKVKLLNNLFKNCMLYIEAVVDTHGVHRMEIWSVYNHVYKIVLILIPWAQCARRAAFRRSEGNSLEEGSGKGSPTRLALVI